MNPMAEAVTKQSAIENIDWTPTAALVAGQVIHLPDGRAAYAPTEIAAGVLGSVQVSGIVTLLKPAAMVMLKGTRVYWDHSASKSTVVFGTSTLDYYVGVVEESTTAAATTVDVSLNQEPAYTVSLKEGFHSVPVDTAGQTQVIGHGNGVSLIFDTATEAQKQDALSIRDWPVAADGILTALICVNLNGDDAAFDLNIGIANATHATDADSITESLFCHINGSDLNIYAESDDGTTEVAATDTTIDFVVGTPFLFQADCTDNSDVQLYIDGVAILTAPVFDLSAATGPLKLLVHAEKTSNNSPGNITVMDMGFIQFDV
jgi:predicted RecA/RadA family phage recombinase